ncbi:patatin family protein [Youngiibacter multivorans]
MGLVLEGGGMRGLYTAGVLDYFMEKGLYFPYVIGVSAGACNAISYISRQKGRSRKINIDFVNDHRYLNYTNLLKGKGIFDMDFIFDQIPNNLIPFNYNAFNAATERLVVPATDCQSGMPVYFERDKCEDLYSAVKASSSLPFVGEMVFMEEKLLLDGGIADPIPILKAIQDGNQMNVIVLTRENNYRKEHFMVEFIAKYFYSDYTELIHAITNRHNIYNTTLEYIAELEEKGKVFVIRPKDPVKIKGIVRDINKLNELYTNGYNDAASSFEKMSLWIRRFNEE